MNRVGKKDHAGIDHMKHRSNERQHEDYREGTRDEGGRGAAGQPPEDLPRT